MAWKAPGAGKLRQRITLQQLDASATPDDTGHNNTWEDYFTCWAQIIPKGSREFFGGDQTQSDVTHQVVVRSCTETRGTRSAMRFRYGGVIYQLAGPPFDPEGKRAWLVFNAIQGAV